MISKGWVLVAGLSLGCAGPQLESSSHTGPSETNPSQKPVALDDSEKKTGGIWSDCYSSFTPSGEPKADLDRLTRACGPTGGMKAITPVKLADQTEREPADRYTFFVPSAGACYRVYATGDRNVRDLDLLLRGPDGEDMTGDLTHDAHPVLPPGGPLCFDTPGLYMLEVSVFKGSGRYALQIWGNPAGLSRKKP